MNTSFLRLSAVALIALLLFAMGLAIGPRVAQDQLRAPSPTGGPPNCLTAIDLPGPFGLLLNCDSPAFMEAASHPATLAEPGNLRQSRPGQIWLAWLISQPTRLFTAAMINFASREDVGLPQGATRTRAQAIADLGPVFIAFFLINVGMLVASVWLLRSCIELSTRDTSAAALAGSALLFNDISKSFLLTPHTQLMNILLPMVMLALLYRWFRGVDFTARQWWGLGALCGFGLLAYATWALVPIVMIMALVWSWVRGSKDRMRARRAAVHVPAMLLLCVVPYALWYAYVLLTAGSFYVHETSYDGGLVWIWRNDPLAVVWQLLSNIVYLLGAAAGQSLPLLAFVLPPLLVLGRFGFGLADGERRDIKLATMVAGLVTLLFLCFFALLGFRIWRYAVPLLPAWTLPIALLNASALARLRSTSGHRAYIGVLMFMAVAIAVFQVAKEGPWG